MLEPRLLIADEPTTALDTLSQREVLELMVALTREMGTALLLITHDLGLVAQYTDRVLVLEKGVLVEAGRTRDVLAAPGHPYTAKQIGRESCRERVCQYVYISVVAVSLKNKKRQLKKKIY